MVQILTTKTHGSQLSTLSDVFLTLAAVEWHSYTRVGVIMRAVTQDILQRTFHEEHHLALFTTHTHTEELKNTLFPIQYIRDPPKKQETPH
jgi:hypothetical protein